MANTAFFGTLSLRGRSGRTQSDRFDNTDVSLVFCTFKSNGGLSFLDVKEDGNIVDCVLNIVASDTTKYFKLWIDQTDTNIAWVQAASFPTINNRFFNMNPVPVRRGQRIMIQAIT